MHCFHFESNDHDYEISKCIQSKDDGNESYADDFFFFFARDSDERDEEDEDDDELFESL